MTNTVINYMELPLRGKEKAIFFLCIITAGLAVGILFYDSLAVSAVTAALLLMAMPQYKEKVVRKHQQELLMQFKDLLYSISASVSSGRNMADALAESKVFCGGSYEKSDYIMIELDHMTAMLSNGNETDTEVLYDFARRSGLSDAEDFARDCRCIPVFDSADDQTYSSGLYQTDDRKHARADNHHDRGRAYGSVAVDDGKDK